MGGPGESLPVVHLPVGRHHLVVYHAINCTVCLLLSSRPEPQFYTEYDDQAGPALSDLSADLTHIWATANTPRYSALGHLNSRALTF